MRFARRVCVVILAVLLVFVSVTLGKDPYKEYQKCQKQCQQESEGGYSQQKRCQQGCAEELQRRQEEKGSGRGSDDMYEDFGFFRISPRGRNFYSESEITGWLFLKLNLKPSLCRITGTPILSCTLPKSFFGAGGENPESFYRAFSDEILEAALNTRKDKWQRLFGQQRQGAILKASQEQIRAMSREEEGGQWPFGGQSKGSVNIYEQRPSQSNQYGKLYEVDSRQYRQLQDIDVSVSLANVTKGAMIAPYYNSEATKISIVLDGEGYFEMACPHLSSHQEGQGQQQHHGGSQQQARAILPESKLPSQTRHSCRRPSRPSFRSSGFKQPESARKKNIINQFEREAKELAFGVSAREVDEVFRSQNEEFFFKGPRQQHQGRADE
ncbi:7S globulin [Forsythia ovata]|uniref:7S globulin n=1 Tax=Forsythia ovata TaxID=205694 RepID=A0ABD1WCF2_9LAMI